MLYIKNSLKIQVINQFSIIAKHIIIHLYALPILKLKLHCQDIFIAFNFIFLIHVLILSH